MKSHYIQKSLLMIAILSMLWTTAISQVPAGYYNSASGLTGSALKQELHDITTTGHTPLSYSGLWTAFGSTDRDVYYENNSTILDMYSEKPSGADSYEFTYSTNQCGTFGAEGDCYNREHSFPKSWWGGAESGDKYTDLNHLYPTDGYTNGRRANYAFGEVGTASWTSTNGTKLGTSNYPGVSGTVFEPIDEFKGDFARMLFYMACRYKDEIPTWYSTGTDIQMVFQSNGEFQTAYYEMLFAWHTADPVSQKELDRNDAVYNAQGNANPFIDHPEYVCEIWGGSGCTIKPEPTNHATGLTATDISDSQIDLSWTDAVAGTQAPDGYLIVGNTTNSFTDPTDGTDPTIDSDLSDGYAIIKVAHGAKGGYSFTGLNASTQYYFKMWSYTNSGSNIDFKTDPVIPVDDATTKAPAPATTTCEDFENFNETGYYTGVPNPALATGAWDFTAVYKDNLTHGGSVSCRINDNVGGANMTTPSLNTVGTVTFWIRPLNSESSTFELQKSVGGGAFTTIDSYTYGSSQTYEEYSFDVNESSNNVKIRILNDNQTAHLIVDDFCWTDYSASGPEIKISGNSTEISDGDNTPEVADDTDFGSTPTTGGTVAHTFTIENTGNSDLTVSTITFNPATTEFSMTSLPGLPATIAASGNETFEVTFNPTTDGAKTATVEVTSDDTDEATYTFDITGTGTPAPSVTLADNGTQVTAADVAQGTSTHILSTFMLSIADADATLSQIDFTVASAGTFAAGDADVYQLWIDTDNDITGATQIGSDVNNTGTGSYSFTALSQALATATGDYYFWITTNIDATATVGNELNIAAIANSDITIAGANKSGSASASGSQTIILYSGPCASETFSNISTGSSSYGTETWTGDDGDTWTAHDARTDVTINGPAICFKTDVVSPTYSGGIGDLTVTTLFPYSDGSNTITIKVNGISVGTVPISETENTYTLSGINVAGNVVVTFEGNGSDRFAIDDVSWACYTAGPPSNVTIADNGTQVTASTEQINTNNVILHQSQISAADEDATLTGITCTTVGTYLASDIDNFKVYYSTDATFDGGDAILSTQNSPATAGAQTFPSFTSQLITAGTTGYIFITADLSGTAVGGRTINVSALTTADYTFTNANKSGTTTAGGVKTFYDADVVLTQNGSVAAANVAPGQTNIILSSWDLTSNAGAATLNQAVMTVTGTYVAADIAANGYKLWSSATNDFATATQVGSSVSAPGDGLQFITFSGLSETIADGGTVYFWFTVDIATGATAGNNIQRTTTLGSNFSYDENVHKSGSYGAEGLQTIAIPTMVVADNGTQVAAADVLQNTPNHIVSTFKIDVTNSNATLTDADIYFDGSYVAGDIDASGFKLWYNSADDFSTATTLNSQSATGSGGSGEIISFTGFSQNILQNATGYFWVTADISAGATIGNTIQNLAVDNTDLTFVVGNKSGSASIAGVQTIIERTNCATELIISQVCENGNDNYVEIYNNTGSPVSLVDYDLVIYYNNNGFIGETIDLDDAETIVDGDVWVVADNGSAAFAGIDQTVSNLTTNGNEKIALRKSGVEIDMFGVVGTSTDFYDNQTYIRNETVFGPTTTFDAGEWTISAYAGGDPGTLGAHTMTCSCDEPTADASNMTFSAITGNSMTVNWANGDGVNRIIVAREGGAVNWEPTDNTTYTANASFGAGTALGAGSDNYVVYNGNGTSVNVTGLNPGTEYFFKVYEYGCLPGSEDYFISGTPLEGSETTLIGDVTNLTASCVSNTTAEISWNLPTGTYDAILVTVNQGGTPNVPNVAGASLSAPNVDFSSASGYSGGGVGDVYVFNADAGTVEITGLTASTSYTVKVFAYAGDTWSAGVETTINTVLQGVTGETAIRGNAYVDISWTNPSCFNKIIVVGNDGGSPTEIPDGAEIANSDWTLAEIVTTNDRVVYNGVGSSVRVTNLTNGNNYCFKIYAMKGTDITAGAEVGGDVCATPLDITIIEPGNLAIVDVNTSHSTIGDIFTFVCFQDIKAETPIDFTDNGWEAVNAGAWGDGEGCIRITRKNSTLPAGTSVTVVMNGSNGQAESDFDIYVGGVDDLAAGNWTVVEENAAAGAGFNLNSFDDMWIMQNGEWINGGTDNDTYSGNILYGWTATGWPGDFANYEDDDNPGEIDENKLSYLYPGMNCFQTNVAGTANNSKVKFNDPDAFSVARNRFEWIALINDAGVTGNWSYNADDGAYDLATPDYYGTGQNFQIVAGTASPGIWTGSNSTDWFDCSNWLNLTVPTSSTNVTVNTTYATDDVVIDDDSPVATEYGNIAECNNIDIETQTLIIEGDVGDELYVSGNLTISGDGSIDMDGGGAEDGIIYLSGNWANTSTANTGDAFLQGLGTVQFVGSSEQTISHNGSTETFANFVVNNGSATGVTLNDDLVTEQTFTHTDGFVNFNTKDITISGAYVRTNGLFKGNTNSNFLINGTGALGEIYFNTDQNIGNITMNRNGETANLMTNLTVSNTMYVQDGAINLRAGKFFTVNILTNDVGSAGLVLKSDAFGTASLIQTTGAVPATYERHLVGGEWNYISTPLDGVNGTSILQGSGEYGYWYNESPADYWDATIIYGSSGWTEGINNPMSTNKGYIHYSGGTKVYSLLGGNLTTSDKTFNCTYTENGTGTFVNTNGVTAPWETFEGWNLIGNPFASAVDWTQVNLTNVEDYVYYYDGTNYQCYSGLPYNQGITVNGGTEFIPSGQGVFVKANATTDPKSVTIPASARTHNGQAFWKGEKSTPENVVKLNIQKGLFTDEMIVRTLPETTGVTELHDGQYDAYKMFAWDNSKPQIYSRTAENTNYFAINSLPEFESYKIVPLGMYLGVAGEYVINFSENTFANTHIWLEDRVLEQNINLLDQSSYTFSQAAETTDDRFYLHFNQNHAPYVMLEIPNQSVEVENQFKLKLIEGNFVERDQFDYLTYSVNDIPEWLTYENGAFVGTPSKTGIYTVNITATDRFGASVNQSFSIKVYSNNTTNIVEDENSFAVYPNPTNGKVNIEFATNIDGEITVVNVAGQVVSRKNIKGQQTELNLSDIARGVYFINVNTDGKIYRQKLILK